MKLKWQQAPVKTQWGDDMVVASVAIDKDHTVCLYCERDQTPKVDAMFAQRTWKGQIDNDAFFKSVESQPEQDTNKNGSPCPEFWDWLPKAYNFEGNGNFTKYNMEVAFLAGKQAPQTEQEPVVWMYVNRSTHETIFQRHMRSFVDHGNWTETPLYSEPLANHELNCVCGAVWCGDEMVHLPHKSTPPQRTWVGLTDEEVEEVWKRVEASDFRDVVQPFAQAIEAALRSKNT
jgi:hypothetical protein